MTVPFDSGSVPRPTALTALAALLLAAACSAPPGADDDDGLPEFGGGAVQTPAAPGAGGAPSAVGTPNASAPVNDPVAPAPTPVNPNEQTGNGGIGIAPPSSGSPSPSNQSGNQNQGAGGSAMVAPDPNAGSGGSSFETPAAGGATSLPPNDGNQQPPPNDGNQQPPPNDGNQQPPPNDGNQQPPPAPVTTDCGSAFFCDDFEGVAAGASPNPALWSIMFNYSPTEANANVQVSAANARGGNQALRVEPMGRTGIFTSVPQSSYFIRAFMQIDEVGIGPVFIGAGTEANNEVRFRIQGQSFATINSVGAPQNDAVRPDAANSGNCPDCLPLVANQWLCVEMGIDSGASTATLWIDGVEAAVATAQAFVPQPANPTVFFGTMDVQGGSTGIWIDDIAVASTRIGCN